ncbi:site-specific integrase [Candidatus Nitrosocosmicus oleophilus]|uniref:site-specific integrase n=1 Tax=Candidatus Nitrosocosmicus oleophilus TaxID=1353260 RepID=UPI0018CB03FE|nr:site-specific integrase [Candidatus Nitrosocosmicus oleophilus]
MGSNPTPRAYLGYLYDNFKSNDNTNDFRTTHLAHETILGFEEEDKNRTISEKIYSITKSCSKPYFNKILIELYNHNTENANTVCDYLISEETEINIKNSTKEGRIKILVWLSVFHENKKLFSKMSKQDILSFLNNLRRPVSEDPTQRWVGSYNGRQIILNKFFRWLYNPQEPNQSQRITPECMIGIKQLPRKEKTPYSPSDLWEPLEHTIFLRYCPNVRDRCYHALANDMSARPHEILNLKIKDIIFKKTKDNKQYAEVLIKGGKTKSRTVPLIDSIPYVKELINLHPTGSNPDSWLFVSKPNTAFGSKLTLDGLTYQYKYFYKIRFFPRLLEDQTVPEADKALIRNLITKKWNLYVLRHSALTQKSQILKEHVLRDHAGWSMSSKMPQTYIHYFGNESAKSLLQYKGILDPQDKENDNTTLRPRQCPNCNEPNKLHSKFCVKCRMVLTYDSYSEVRNEDRQKIDKLEKDMGLMKEGMNKILLLIQQNNDLANVKPEVLQTVIEKE